MKALAKKRPLALLAIASAMITLMSCAKTGTSSSAQESSPRPPSPVTAIPRPSAAPVLTISGNISNHNQAQELVFDLAALESLPRKTLNVYEPFLKKRVTFTGVDMRELLATGGVKPGASKAHFTALDDYKVDLDIDLLMRGGILLATKDSGASIPIDAGGPIRIIFPDGNRTGENSDLWIWSVRTIEVR